MLSVTMASGSPSPPDMSRGMVLFFAAASGMSVVTGYYSQPLLETLASDFGLSYSVEPKSDLSGRAGDTQSAAQSLHVVLFRRQRIRRH